MPAKETEATQAEKPQGTSSNPSSEYRLYLMRHGDAVPRSEDATGDSKRPLTPDGKRKMKEIARGLVRLGATVDWIVSSPLVRAVETAEIVAGALEPGARIDQCDALRPGGSPEALISFLAAQPRRARVLAVGHEPSLSEFAARLTGGGRHMRLAFKKGGCCLIAFDEFPPGSPGTLHWWLTPRILRRIR